MKNLINNTQFIEDLSSLISINSSMDIDTKTKNAPFGIGVRQAFDKFIDICNRDGFEVNDIDGYALEVNFGTGQEIIGILGHLDIVEQLDGWDQDPFKLTIKDNYIYGRGVNDNKGPMLGCYYLFRHLKETGYIPNKTIRLILGGAEETTWECIDYYFKHRPQPDLGFSPDGNFPIVNCERGIAYFSLVGETELITSSEFEILSIKTPNDTTKVCRSCIVEIKDNKNLINIIKQGKIISNENSICCVEYRGSNTLARNAFKGENAILKMVSDFSNISDCNISSFIYFLKSYFCDNHYANSLGLFHKDDLTGTTSSNISRVTFNGDKVSIYFDYRYPSGIDYENSLEKLRSIAITNNLKLTEIDHKAIHYIKSDTKVIQGLSIAYKKVIGQIPETLSKAAASYARATKNCVAFGPTFDGEVSNSHKENENMNIDNFTKALEIYYHAILELDKQ